MSTFTVSDYLIDSPNNKEYIQFQNQLLKNRQMQNRQFAHDQLSLSQFNNYYNVTPQQYNGSDQYKRNVFINDNPSNFNNKEGLTINTKKLGKERNNNLNNNMVDSNELPNMYNFNNNNQNVMMNPLFNGQYKDNGENYSNGMPSTLNMPNRQQINFPNENDMFEFQHISPKVKDKKHKYLNQYHDFNLATRQGWIYVKYGTFKIWKKRWAILVYDTLYLLKDQYINNEVIIIIIIIIIIYIYILHIST